MKNVRWKHGWWLMNLIQWRKLKKNSSYRSMMAIENRHMVSYKIKVRSTIPLDCMIKIILGMCQKIFNSVAENTSFKDSTHHA